MTRYGIEGRVRSSSPCAGRPGFPPRVSHSPQEAAPPGTTSSTVGWRAGGCVGGSTVGARCGVRCSRRPRPWSSAAGGCPGTGCWRRSRRSCTPARPPPGLPPQEVVGVAVDGNGGQGRCLLGSGSSPAAGSGGHPFLEGRHLPELPAIGVLGRGCLIRGRTLRDLQVKAIGCFHVILNSQAFAATCLMGRGL